MSRKTVNVRNLIEKVNHKNKVSTCDPLVRQGWNSLLEDILHQTDNYNGFNYYYESDLAPNTTPGIRTEIDKYGVVTPCKDYEKRFKDTDDTRIFFYIKPGLQK